MSGEMINAGRSLEQVTNGIRMLSGQIVANACQIGKLLAEAKAMVGHGGWGEYLEKEVSYSQSTANNFMRLFEEYGEFGPNSQTIANFGPSKALALLALPAEQREQFAEEHKDDSVRQLKAEIAKLTKQAADAEARQKAHQQQLVVAAEENGALKQRLNDIDADYKAQLDTVDRENDDLRKKLARAESREPEISEADAERLRKEGAAAAMDASRELITAAEAKGAAIAAEKDREIESLRAELAKAPKAAPSAMGDPDMAAFGVLLAQLGESVNRMLGHYKKTQGREPANAEKMRAALNAFHGRLGEAIAKMEG